MRKNILLLCVICIWVANIGFTQSSKPRTIVTTDGELDDVDSFIRMLLCLLYTSRCV